MTSTGQSDRAARLERAIAARRAAGRSSGRGLPPRPEGQPARLSDLQRGLWLLYRMDPRSPAYNLASAFQLSGPVDRVRLERSLSRVVARHRLLRSTFQVDGDTARQVVRSPAPVAIETIQTGDATGGDVRSVAASLARRPFDLERGPVLRAALIEDASTRERLVLLVLHHIVADARSLGRLWQELALDYTGQRPDGDDRTPQFDDYVYWLSRQPTDGRSHDLAFWRERLDPGPEPLVLPFERRPGEPSQPRGCLLGRRLDADVRAGVGRVAAAAGATPFAVYAFVFRLLLERYVPGRRLAFATPVSTRSHPATGDMIGYFLNPVVVPTTVDEAHPVEVAVRRFSDELRDLLAHAAIPFETVSTTLGQPRDPDRHPVFQVMFVFQEQSPPPG